MKTYVKRLGYCLVMAVLTSCSHPESEEPVIDSSPDVTEVSTEYMESLMTAYKKFVENLTEDEKAKLSNYVNSISNRATGNAKTTVETRCRCLATQAFCEAFGKVGECCACWDPETQVGMCGVYAGIASCVVEERPQRTKNPVKPSPTPKTISISVRIFPSQIKNLVDYVDRSRLGTANPTSTSGLNDFKTLLDEL